MTAFNTAWDLLKMPFVNVDGALSTDVLYQGRRSGEKDTGYWTPHKSKALAYALYGPRYDWEGTPFVDANVHYPELHMATAPKDEYIDIEPDDEYMGGLGEDGAISSGRVAFHDSTVGKYSQRLPDKHVAQIIENIINSDLYDKEADDVEEDFHMDDAEPWEYNKEWDRIFMPPKGAGRVNWESLNTVKDDSHVRDALEEHYHNEEPSWDLVTTNQVLTGGTLNDFVRRLRERDDDYEEMSNPPYTLRDGLYYYSKPNHYHGRFISQDGKLIPHPKGAIERFKSFAPPRPRREDWEKVHRRLTGEQPMTRSEAKKILGRPLLRDYDVKREGEM